MSVKRSWFRKLVKLAVVASVLLATIIAIAIGYYIWSGGIIPRSIGYSAFEVKESQIVLKDPLPKVAWTEIAVFRAYEDPEELIESLTGRPCRMPMFLCSGSRSGFEAILVVSKGNELVRVYRLRRAHEECRLQRFGEDHLILTKDNMAICSKSEPEP